MERFQFGFVPEAAVIRGREFIHPSATFSREETTRSWVDQVYTASLAKKLTDILPGPYSTKSGQLGWGSPDCHHIDVLLEGECVVDVAVTIDVSAPYLALISELSLLANRLRWVTIMRDGRIFRPCVRRFLAEILHCRTTLWIGRSPHGFASARRTMQG